MLFTELEKAGVGKSLVLELVFGMTIRYICGNVR